MTLDMEEFPAVLDDRLHEAGGAEQLEKIMQNAQRASDFLKALAHETRLLVLCLLAERERSVTELENILSLRQPTVSQQLARLRLDGLVTTRRDGKTIYYSLNDDDIRRVISLIYDLFCHGGNHNRKASALGLEK